MSDAQMSDQDAGGAGSEFVDSPSPPQPGRPPQPGARRAGDGSPSKPSGGDVPEDSPLRPETLS